MKFKTRKNIFCLFFHFFAYIFIMNNGKVKVLKRVNKNKKSTFKKIFAICLLILCLIIFYYFVVVCPIIIKLSEEKVKAMATQSVSEVVGDVMIESNLTYDDLVNIKYSGENKIELIEINSVNTNIIIRKITKSVQDKFDCFENKSVNISFGTFTGIPFLYGIGPNISIKLVPVGIIDTKLVSNFISGGINQTLHKLSFFVSSNIGLVLPTRTRNFETELEVLICESVIIGQIPDVYLEK